MPDKSALALVVIAFMIGSGMRYPVPDRTVAEYATLAEGLRAFESETGVKPNAKWASNGRMECVGFVRSVRPDSLPSTQPTGIAHQMWLNAIKDGWNVGEKPKEGAIMVWKPWGKNTAGHVAVVVSTNPLTVWDSNWSPSLDGKIRKRVVTDKSNVVGYIYGKDSVQPPQLGGDLVVRYRSSAGQRVVEVLGPSAARIKLVTKHGEVGKDGWFQHLATSYEVSNGNVFGSGTLATGGWGYYFAGGGVAYFGGDKGSSTWITRYSTSNQTADIETNIALLSIASGKVRQLELPRCFQYYDKRVFVFGASVAGSAAVLVAQPEAPVEGNRAAATRYHCHLYDANEESIRRIGSFRTTKMYSGDAGPMKPAFIEPILPPNVEIWSLDFIPLIREDATGS